MMKFIGFIMVGIPLVAIWFVVFAIFPVPVVVLTFLFSWFYVGMKLIKG